MTLYDAERRYISADNRVNALLEQYAQCVSTSSPKAERIDRKLTAAEAEVRHAGAELISLGGSVIDALATAARR